MTPAATPFAADEGRDRFLLNLSPPGKWAKHAASFLMKLPWAARQAVPQMSWSIHSLASQLHKWSTEADRRLHRLYQYVVHVVNQDWVLTGSLSTQDLGVLELRGWPDADLNGDDWTTRSTSGCFVELAGAEGRSIPLTWFARKQTCTSTHICEAETVSLVVCLKSD